MSSIQSFHGLEFQDKFPTAVRTTPQNIRTRVIVIESHGAYQRKGEINWKWPKILDVPLVDALGFTYDIEPLFFNLMVGKGEAKEPLFVIKNYHRYFDRKFNPAALAREFWAAEYPLADFESQESTTMTLGFDHGKAYKTFFEGPRLWMTLTRPREGVGFNVVVMRYCLGASNYYDPSNMTPSFFREDDGGLRAWQPVRTTLPPPLIAIKIFTRDRILAANQNPKQFVEPFFEMFEPSFRRYAYVLRLYHQRWLSSSIDAPTSELARIDQDLTLAWQEGRCAIEDFELITSRLKDFQDNPGESGQLKAIIGRHERLLGKARLLEQHVRDTITLKVGNLSLQESRKSIRQADAIGRISFLAFIFIPLSLATSFFGMNIDELTGSGASWRVFAISTATLCACVLLVCSWLWRRSRRLRFVVYSPLIPVLWTISVPKFFYNKLRYGKWYFSDVLGEYFMEDWWEFRKAFLKRDRLQK